jgi:hypothetical protein
VTTRELREFEAALREVRELKPVLRRRDSTRPPRAQPGQTDLQKEDSVYIPRNPMLSIIQSAVEEAIEQHQPEAIDEPPERGPDGRRAGRPVPTITERRLKDAPLVITPGRRVWKPFEVATGGWVWLSDPRWAFSLAHKFWRDATDNFAPFLAAPSTVPIEDNAQIFLVGDWGSGLDRATRVAAQIKKEMARRAGRQQIVIHLGDVYYSGTERELKKRFLSRGQSIRPPRRCRSRSRATTICTQVATPISKRRSLTSASPGRAAAATSRSGAGSGRSSGWIQRTRTPVCTRNRPHGLEKPFSTSRTTLARSCCPTISRSARTGTAFRSCATRSRRCLPPSGSTPGSGVTNTGVFSTVQRRSDAIPLNFSSCLGHGGVPEYLVMKEGETRPAPWVYEYLKVNSDNFQPWDTFGFAVLEIAEDKMSVRYIDENGARSRRSRCTRYRSRWKDALGPRL